MATTMQIRPLPPAAARPALLGIVNTNASGASHVLTAAVASVARSAGRRIEVLATECVEELAEAVRDADGRRLLVVGGDGSIHAVANLAERPDAIALIPAGRANNVARSLGIPTDLKDAVRMAIEGRVRPIDLIEARTPDRRYVTVEGVSVGYLAEARVRYRGRNSADCLAALEAGAKALAGFHPHAVRVRSAGRSEDLALAQLFVANLPLYEFGLRVAPHADPTDELLDFVGIMWSGRLGIPVMLARLLRGSYPPGVHLWRAVHGRIATHGASPIVADSEDLGTGPVDLAVLPRALRIVRP